MSSLVTPSYRPPFVRPEIPLPPVGDTILLDAGGTVPLHPSLDHQIIIWSTKAHEDDIREQICNLGQLQDGWLDGSGKACDPRGLANLADQLVSHYPFDAPELRLYPTGDGNVQAEWWVGNYNAVLEVFLDGTSPAEWSDFHLQTKVETVRSVNINDEQDWEWVVQRLQSLS
ncbi:MAG: hypothetical protein OXP69_22310 [Spirochaetaceae bacterium]|nr:hypothetical protein [Spirochaetaceae bacterium]